MKPRIVVLTHKLDGSYVCMQLLDLVRRLSDRYEIVVAMTNVPHKNELVKKFAAVAKLEQLPQGSNDAAAAVAGLCWDAAIVFRTWPFFYRNICNTIQREIVDIHPGALMFGYAPRFEIPRDLPELDMRNIDIAITAAPRQISYLAKTILSAYATGFRARPHVFAEPGTTWDPKAEGVHQDQFFWHQNEERLGQWKNWLQSIEYMLENSSQDYIMLCEDDVSFLPHAGYLFSQALDLPQAGCWAFYSPVRNYMSAHHSEVGWFALKERSPWGALALCFPRKVLKEVYKLAVEQGPKTGKPDEELGCKGGYLAQLGLQWYTHAPNLADHLGYQSTLGHEHWADSVGIGCKPGV